MAHRIDEYLQATLLSLQTDHIHASMRLIPGTTIASQVIDNIDRNGDGVLSKNEERVYAERVLSDLSFSVDEVQVEPKLISWSFPSVAQMREGIGEIQIECAGDLPTVGENRSLTLANHHLRNNSVYLMNVLAPQDQNIRVITQKRSEDQSLFRVDYQQVRVGTGASGRVFWSWLDGVQLSRLYHLGMRHIAQGTDHLLFLLTLLLPAPLLVSGSRWGAACGARQGLRRILSITTAFAVGHSITLTLAALGMVHMPERSVEVLIAVSIFLSAMHGIWPIFPGKEALIAVFFGLVHGLAFATTLDNLGIRRWERLEGIFAFNLGIETMQILVVALILPSLIVMSKTPMYSLFRIGGATFAGGASVTWIVTRLLNVDTPIDIIVNAFARHAIWIAGPFFLFSLACWLHRYSSFD